MTTIPVWHTDFLGFDASIFWMVLTIFELKEHFVRQQFMLKKAPKTVLWAKHIEHDCRHRRVRRTSGSTLRIIGNEPNEIKVFSDGLRRLAESSRRYLKPKQILPRWIREPKPNPSIFVDWLPTCLQYPGGIFYFFLFGWRYKLVWIVIHVFVSFCCGIWINCNSQLFN